MEEDDDYHIPAHAAFEKTVHDSEHAFEEVVGSDKGVLNDVLADIELINCYICTFLFVTLEKLFTSIFSELILDTCDSLAEFEMLLWTSTDEY